MPHIRTQKMISGSGLLTRRKADLLIKQCRVSLNGLQEGNWRELKESEWISLID